jgi:aryl-alcohol dehydrogenase-like predicted oxidoreductase
MKKRNLGNTGFEVTELGYGAWPLGNNGKNEYGGELDEEEGKAVIRAYVEGGGNFIDTARAYGERSERLIGTVVKESYRREDLYIATKTQGGATMDTLSQIREDLEESLRLLQMDYVDILQLHQPPEDPEVMKAALDELDNLKNEGKIRAVGASIKGKDVTDETLALCRQYITTGRVEVLQVVYSILRQKHFPAIEEAHKAGVGIITRTSMESGLLTGKYEPGHRFGGLDHRRRYDPKHLDYVLEKVQEIKEELFIKKKFDLSRKGFSQGSLAQVAVRFAMAPPGVSTVIAGARNLKQIEENLAVAALPELPKKLVDYLRFEYGDITEKANFE